MSQITTLMRPGHADAHAAIRSLLCPRSVAVIGAIPDHTRMNGAPVRNLLDFEFRGDIYPVNDRYDEISGLRCYRDLDEIAGEIDTAVIAVRADRALDWIGACAERGMRSATVISAGFHAGDAGEQGARLGAELAAVLRRYPIRILGPNTAGLLNLRHAYVPRGAFNNFGPAETRPGHVAIICQSGALSNTVFNKCQAHGVGVAYSLATGDQADLDVTDFVDYAVEDDDVTVIICVLEGARDCARFAAALRAAAAKRKPVILLKLGQSDAGAAAVTTHSGSVSGAFHVFRAAARQGGAIEAVDLDQLWELAGLFSAWNGPDRPAAGMDSGRRSTLGVISISGADGAYVADRVAETELFLPAVSDRFAGFVAETFAFAQAANPFDATGEVLAAPAKLEAATARFVADNDFDYTLFAAPVFRSELASNLYGAFFRGMAGVRGRVAASLWTSGDLTRDGLRSFIDASIPTFEDCGRAVRALAAFDRWRRQSASGIALRFPEGGRVADPLYHELRAEMIAAGVDFAPGHRLAAADAALLMKPDHGAPIDIPVPRPWVLKADCRSQTHKRAAGLVRLGLVDTAALASALRDMPLQGAVDGWMVEEQIHADLELLLGGATDPDFGKIIVLGFGGALAELVGAPAIWVGDPGAGFADWVMNTPAGRLLAAAQPGMERRLADLACAAADWFMASPSLRGFDINPVVLDLARSRLSAVDCRVE